MSGQATIVDGGAAQAALAAQAGDNSWRDWLALLKPRVVSLVVFTGAMGLLIAPGHINPVLGFTAVLCIAVAAGAAGCLNMWWEADIDAKMRRTARRPIPAGKIAPDDALSFGIALSVASVMVMGLALNICAAVVLAISIFFYVVIYTIWLKRITPQNIVIGGAAGAFPPIIGWAAVTGDISLMPVLMFALVFFWTPPHFWSLALYACEDYGRAGVPMLPVVAGPRETRRQIFLYSLLMSAVAVAPWALRYTGAVYGVTAIVFSAVFVGLALTVLREKQDGRGKSLAGDRAARRTFRFSLLYLAVLFLALGIDRLVR
jgi:protoheme IX farnesyltransferase